MVVHSVIPALNKLRQEDLEFKATLGCINRPGVKKKRNKNPKPKQKSEYKFFSASQGTFIKRFTICWP
jgi:hypothetical protein